MNEIIADESETSPLYYHETQVGLSESGLASPTVLEVETPNATGRKKRKVTNGKEAVVAVSSGQVPLSPAGVKNPSRECFVLVRLCSSWKHSFFGERHGN